jgi:hypothetical protein
VDDEALGRRFQHAIDAALAAAPRRPPAAMRFGLPPVVRATLSGAAERCGGRLPEVLGEYYLERMPRMLVEQLYVADDPAARLLWRPVGDQPRLAAALAALGVPLRGRAPAELHGAGLFGGSAPLLGAFPDQRDLMNRELAAGADADAVLDLRLSGNLAHELCHGEPAPGLPWTVLEAIAVTRGARARPAHIFPDVPGEAVPGVSLFVVLGDVLARRFGADVLDAVARGEKGERVFGAGPARVFAEAGWEAWLARRYAPFVLDALDCLTWARLAELARAGLDPERPERLALAEHTDWAELPWWSEEPTADDHALLATGVRALFQLNTLAPTYQTHPAELAGGWLALDTAACTLTAAARPAGVFAEPPVWLAPPPLCRRLSERGARRVLVHGAARARHVAITAALLELADGHGPIPAECELAAGAAA